MKRFEMSDQSTVYRYSIIDNVENGVLKVNECVVLLNKLNEENEQLRQSYKYADELLEEIREVFEKNGVETGYNKRILETCFSALYENEQLKERLFECRKDYLTETADISDKIYLEDEIKKLKKEYGVIDDE